MLVADRAKYQSQLKDQVDYMEHSIYIAKCNRVEGIINTFTDYIAQIDLEIKELIKTLKQVNPYVEGNIFKSVENVSLEAIVAYKIDGVKHSFLETYDEE